MSVEAYLFIIGIVFGAYMWECLRDLRYTYVVVKFCGHNLPARLHKTGIAVINGEEKRVAEVTLLIHGCVEESDITRTGGDK